MRLRLPVMLLIALGAACGPEAEDKPEICLVASTSTAVQAADRRVVGEASPYPADPALAARDEALARSQRARRDMAWQVVARALAPVALAETRLPGPADPPAGAVPTVPR